MLAGKSGDIAMRGAVDRVARGGIRRIESAFVGKRLERVGQPHHGFGGAEDEVAIIGYLPCEPVEYTDLGFLIEINQHVAAEHDVERTERREIVEQIERAEMHHGADVGRELPTIAG